MAPGFQVEVANLGNTALESVEVVNSLVGTFPTLAADPDAAAKRCARLPVGDQDHE